MTAAEKFRKLLASDHRYRAEAYNFIYEALDWTLKNVVKSGGRENQHVSGPELLEGIRKHSIEEFGCLAMTVFERWGITSTADFGELVFNLVDYDLMGKQESDAREDFQDVYDFSDVFELRPVFEFCPNENEWLTSYVERKKVAEES